MIKKPVNLFRLNGFLKKYYIVRIIIGREYV